MELLKSDGQYRVVDSHITRKRNDAAPHLTLGGIHS